MRLAGVAERGKTAGSPDEVWPLVPLAWFQRSSVGRRPADLPALVTQELFQLADFSVR